MKKIASLICILSLLFVVGCYGGLASGPTRVPGFLYAKTKTPGLATPNVSGSKTGKAECESILGLVATGDCSVGTAAKDGGIKKIKTVDHDIYNILGVYTRVTTIVTGE